MLTWTAGFSIFRTSLTGRHLVMVVLGCSHEDDPIRAVALRLWRKPTLWRRSGKSAIR